MKKTFLLLLAHCIGFAQAPAIQWQKRLGGTPSEKGQAVTTTADGGFIIAAQYVVPPVEGDQLGIQDIWVTKTDSEGIVEWQETYGSTNPDSATNIIQTADGGFLAIGETYGNDGDVTGYHGSRDGWIMKLDAGGDIQWSKCYGGSGKDFLKSAVQTADGNFLVAGYSDSTGNDLPENIGGTDGWILKIDPLGNILWSKNYGSIYEDRINRLMPINDGCYVFVGESNTTDNGPTTVQGEKDAWIAKIYPDGVIIWSGIMGDPNLRENFNSSLQTSDGGFLAVGVISGNNSGNAYAVKFDPQGNQQWQSIMGGSSIDYAYDVIENTSGYILACWTLSGDGDIVDEYDGFDAWLVKLDFDGNIQWSKVYGGSQSDCFNNLILFPDNSFVACGYTESEDGDAVGPGFGSYDVWLVKFEAEALGNPEFAKTAFSVYPNPASSQLQFHMEAGLTIDSIRIIDGLGREIIRKNENLTQINIENLASGHYLLQAFSGSRKFQSKFIKQ